MRTDESYRWLFIINGAITLLIGLAGFFMLPDYPNNPNPRAVWLTAEHIDMASERLERHGRADSKRITWESAKRTFSMWIAYFIPALYIATVLAQYGYNYFNLFLKALKNPDGTPTWTTEQVNAIPIAGGAINVLFGEFSGSNDAFVSTLSGPTNSRIVWVWAILSDVYQTRWTLLVAQGMRAPPSLSLVVNVCLTRTRSRPYRTDSKHHHERLDIGP